MCKRIKNIHTRIIRLSILNNFLFYINSPPFNFYVWLILFFNNLLAIISKIYSPLNSKLLLLILKLSKYPRKDNFNSAYFCQLPFFFIPSNLILCVLCFETAIAIHFLNTNWFLINVFIKFLSTWRFFCFVFSPNFFHLLTFFWQRCKLKYAFVCVAFT